MRTQQKRPQKKRRGYKRRPAHVLAAARNEVVRYFSEAAVFHEQGRADLARRRVRAARRAAMKVQLRIPEYWLRYCRRCHHYLVLGENSTLRVRQQLLIRRCLVCGAVRRKRMPAPRQETGEKENTKVRAPTTHPNSSSP